MGHHPSTQVAGTIKYRKFSKVTGVLDIRHSCVFSKCRVSSCKNTRYSVPLPPSTFGRALLGAHSFWQPSQEERFLISCSPFFRAGKPPSHSDGGAAGDEGGDEEDGAGDLVMRMVRVVAAVVARMELMAVMVMLMLPNFQETGETKRGVFRTLTVHRLSH